MSDIEVLAFTVLWATLIGLAGLVLLLYRQVERAYQLSTGVAAGALPAGTEAPDLDILGEDYGTEPLTFPTEDPRLLVFVTTTCEACEDLARRLVERSRTLPVETVILVTGEGFEDLRLPDEGRVEIRAIAHPADVSERYRVSLVPMLYLLRGRTIVRASNDGSVAGLESLLAEAGESSAEGGGAVPYRVGAGQSGTVDSVQHGP